MYLAIRIKNRQTSTGQQNQIGDVVTHLPNNWVESGKDFGSKGNMFFAWIRCPNIPEAALKALEKPDTDIRRRFKIDKSVLPRNQILEDTFKYNKAIDITKVPEYSWDDLKFAVIDKRTGELAAEDDIIAFGSQ